MTTALGVLALIVIVALVASSIRRFYRSLRDAPADFHYRPPEEVNDDSTPEPPAAG